MAKVVATLEDMIPLELLAKPIDELLPGEVMARLQLSSARQVLRIIEQPLIMGEEGGRPADLKQQRLVGDLSLGTLKLGQAAHSTTLKSAADGRLAEILETIYREKAEKEKAGP